MRRWTRLFLCLCLELPLVAGCGTSPPVSPPFPADITRYNTLEDPVSPRRFTIVDPGHMTPSVVQALHTALGQYGWVADSTAPTALVTVAWEVSGTMITTPRLKPRTRQHPYSFTSNGIRYQLYQAYTVMEAVDTPVWPLRVTIVIRDPAAAPEALPLFDGRLHTALELPMLAEHILPQMVTLVFSTFPGQNGRKQTEQVTLSTAP